eukprot:8859399-Pyramimonas_sp.AAC.1
MRYIVRDAAEAAERLGGMLVTSTSKFACIDVKEFFMSGDIHELAEDCTMHLDGEARTVTREAVTILLENQYVRSPHVVGRFRCVVGTGMGLIHSGDVADSALVNIMECHVVRRRIMNLHAIITYMRFKDDILIIYNDFVLFYQLFFHLMADRSKYFRLKLEGASDKTVRWLQLEVCKWQNIVVTKPAFKDSTLAVPLSCSSAHPPHIHRTWPMAMWRSLE